MYRTQDSAIEAGRGTGFGGKPDFWVSALSLGWYNHLLTDALGSTAPCPPTALLTTVAAMSGDFESKPDVDPATVPNMPCASCRDSFSPRAPWPSPTQRLLWNSSQMPAMEREPTGTVGMAGGHYSSALYPFPQWLAFPKKARPQ